MLVLSLYRRLGGVASWLFATRSFSRFQDYWPVRVCLYSVSQMSCRQQLRGTLRSLLHVGRFVVCNECF